MADDDLSRKRKLADTETSPPVIKQGKGFSTAGLFNPTIVTIETSNDDGDSKADWVQTFTVPLDLIAAWSPYFKSLFEGGFAEAHMGYVRLHDVSPWVFRVFVGWLYFHRVFYEPERKKRRIFNKSRPATSASNGNGDDSKTALQGTGQAANPPVDLTAEQTVSEGPESLEDASMAPFASQKEEETPTTLPLATSRPIEHKFKRRHPPGGNKNKFRQNEIINYGTKEKDAHERDYRDPLTWPWRWLLELYIFADKYDVRSLRITVFDIIQMKVLQTKPRCYPLVGNRDLTWAVENLPPSSPLYRFLVDCESMLGLEWYGDDAEAQGAYLEALPGHFLSRCYVAARRKESAARCPKCKVGGTGEDCTSKSHQSVDILGFREKEICFYHEHGGDEQERERCAIRWDAILRKIC